MRLQKINKGNSNIITGAVFLHINFNYFNAFMVIEKSFFFTKIDVIHSTRFNETTMPEELEDE